MPFVSSGSWLTLSNCEIYYLSAVNYDPATSDLSFIRANIYPGPGEGGLQLISEPVYFRFQYVYFNIRKNKVFYNFFFFLTYDDSVVMCTTRLYSCEKKHLKYNIF